MKATWQAEKDQIARIRALKERIDELRIEADRATRTADLARAAEIQYGAVPQAEREVEEAEARLAELQSKGKFLKEVVDAEDVATVVARWTGIPVTRMLETEKQRLTHLEDELGSRVVGQHEAIVAVSNAVRRSRAGLQDPNRPIGSFIFLGPTGVGKTETARALAEFLFDDEHAMVRIDMSEYMEKHSVARLIGAPPGYVGYEEGGHLTEVVRRKPYCVILLDEVEKAHPDVFNVLLQVLDDGRMTDGQGRTVNFKNTVIVMTSNLGSQMIQSMSGQDYQVVKLAVMGEVKTHFRPEFVNRIDEIVVFHALDEKNIASIARVQLKYLEKRVRAMEMEIEFTDAAVAELARAGFDPVYGARPLKRAIQHQVENPLSRAILEGKFGPKDTIRADAKGGVFSFDKAGLKRAA
jgi:ATP-dependent Clp protease ATP-binding subunit ClpB